jgi:DNA adenine methylase
MYPSKILSPSPACVPIDVAPDRDARIGDTLPFIKWAGGKRSVLRHLLPLVPTSFGRYFEPFVGGGAMFFALRPKLAVLSDNNERLVRTYAAVRDEVALVIALLESYPHDKEFFLCLRRSQIDLGSDAEVAAWLLYLNRTCFNGLYRVNRSNEFNVPFGRYANPTICDAARLRACSAALQGTELACADFESVGRLATPGDFVYFDPPYLPMSKTSSFTAYTSEGFGLNEHRRLRDLAFDLKARGVHVLISNSSAPAIEELYADAAFRVARIEANRAINSIAAGRGKIAELVIT